MTHDDYDDTKRRPEPGPGPSPVIVLRILAVIDAIAVQGLGVYWVTTWPGRGGLVGAVVATLLLWWAVKRASKALFAFDEYRWMARHFVRLVVLGLALQLVAWLMR